MAREHLVEDEPCAGEELECPHFSVLAPRQARLPRRGARYLHLQDEESHVSCRRLMTKRCSLLGLAAVSTLAAVTFGCTEVGNRVRSGLGGVTSAAEVKHVGEEDGVMPVSLRRRHSSLGGVTTSTTTTSEISWEAPEETEERGEDDEQQSGGNSMGFVQWVWGATTGALDEAAMALHLKPRPTTTTTSTTVTGSSTTTTTTTSSSSTSSTSLTTTTVTTTTYTTTTLRKPTLFCFAVVKSPSWEVGLMQTLYNKHASIFDCEENAVFSNGPAVQIGPIWTKQIMARQVGMGNLKVKGIATSSWLNTLIFMEAWNLVFDDGRWWNHEWIVKVDPDAVFFPGRLKEKLTPFYPAGNTNGPALYVANCDRSWNGAPKELKLYGSFEVFSRNALGMYRVQKDMCKEHLPWQKWGEDLFMEQCMKLMHVGVVNGVGFLADERCYAAPCSDTSKVVFHAYKDVGSWLSCWGQGINAESWVFKK